MEDSEQPELKAKGPSFSCRRGTTPPQGKRSEQLPENEMTMAAKSIPAYHRERAWELGNQTLCHKGGSFDTGKKKQNIWFERLDCFQEEKKENTT